MESTELTIDLIQVFKCLMKKAWVIVLVAAIFGGAMFVYGNQTYVPNYTTTATLYTSYESIDENGIAKSNPSIARTLVDTCISVLNTRTFQEEVIQTANLEMTSSQLATMVTAEAVNKTELFKVTVTANNAEQAALIGNTVAQILPEKVAMVNKDCQVHIMDDALVPAIPQGNSIAKNAVVFAVLGTFLVCCIVATIDLVAQLKEQKNMKLA